MASTKDKVQTALSEVRTLVLGAQILLGFQYQALFTPTSLVFKEVSRFLCSGHGRHPPSVRGAWHESGELSSPARPSQ
jgi:hypothetical protein